MHIPSPLFATLPALLATLNITAAVIVSDPVEAKDGWKLITPSSGTFANGESGLTPVKGEIRFAGRNTSDTKAPATNRGAAKYFKGTQIAPGTYTITINIGKFEGLPFVPNLTVLLLADTNSDGNYSWNERIPISATGATLVKTEKPTPGDGAWTKWTCVFKITPETQNASGQPVSGATLGLLVLSNTKINTGFAFDDVAISHEP